MSEFRIPLGDFEHGTGKKICLRGPPGEADESAFHIYQVPQPCHELHT